MTALLRPDTAPVPEGMSVSGFVCVAPDGVPYWPSARDTAEESLGACFSRADERRLDDLACIGWRCVPITLAARPVEDEGKVVERGAAEMWVRLR